MYTIRQKEKCCVPKCNMTRKDNTILHSFPNPNKDMDRFRTWLHAIGGDILSKDNAYIFKYRRVCHAHFETKYYTWDKRLCANSVPTLNLQVNKHYSEYPQLETSRSKGKDMDISCEMTNLDSKEGIMKNQLCMACLCVGRSIQEVTDEKLKEFYLDALKEIPLDNMNVTFPIVCWECNAMLRNALHFREQVKDNYRILQAYADKTDERVLLTTISRSPRLNIHTNDTVVIPPHVNNFGVKLEDRDKIKKPPNSPIPDSSDMEPLEDIQTVLCDVKKDKRKRKNTLKIRSYKVPRMKRSIKNDVDPVAVTEDFSKDIKNVKTEWNNGKDKLNICNNDTVSPIADTTDDTDTRKDTNCKSNTKTLNWTYSNSNDDKMEVDEDVDISNEGSSRPMDSDTDVVDIDSKIQNFLDDIKNNTKKSKKKQKIVKKGSKTKHILTVELSYDEMQAERTRHARRESFVQAQHKCTSCLSIFNCDTSLQAHHMKKHKVTGDYRCSICKTIISSVEAFTAHYKRHMKRFECTICHKRTTDIKTIYQHLYNRHNISIKKYKCKFCGKVSRSLDTHRYHCDAHKSRVQCPQCDKTFSHRAGLMNHRLSVHEAQNEFPCAVCKKMFRWRSSLRRHLVKHNAEKNSSMSKPKAYCEACDIWFSTACSLQRHLRNSLKHVTYDQLRFICDHCDQRFVDKTKLRDHIEEKHLFRTFQCSICHKPSKNRVGLEQHVRTVHKGRPNNRICHHCGKGFPTKMQLESHIRTHTGERPFMCEYCPVTFSQQSNLYKHHRQVHLNIKSKRYPLCKKPAADGNQTSDPQPTFPLAIMQYVPDTGFNF